MTLLAVERIKLFSTRSPWFCIGLAGAVSIGMSAVVAATSKSGDINVTVTQSFYSFSMTIMMVMATLSVTTEYRFGTIRTTFMSAPGRVRVLLSKAALVAAISAVVGEITAFASWGITRVIRPHSDLAISTSADWRNVAGVGAIFGLAALIAIAVGLLIRQSAGAITALLVYQLLLENLIPIIPKVGDPTQKWLPFINADYFLRAGQHLPDDNGPPMVDGMHYGPWIALLYFAAIAVVLLAVAIRVADKRDA